MTSLDIMRAERDAALDALRDVMKTLRCAAGSHAEAQVYARAREVLALSGLVASAEVAEMHAAYAEWSAKR